MNAYYLSRALVLRTAAQSQFLKAAAALATPATNEVHVASQNELRLVRAALGKTYPQEPMARLLHVLVPESINELPGVPPLLGARAFPAPEAEAPPNALIAQLQALRAAHPGRQHYRLLLINAFGANLGDNLIGLTAFRHVLPVLRAQLPAVAVDVLLGWHADDRLARQFRNVDGIESIRTQGPTLAELGRYQALFDTSNLLDLPRYGKLPRVDWHLWWMGLDPARVPAAEKRNAVAIPDADRQFVGEKLPPADGPRILINPLASVALRSMPESAIRRLVAALLADWPEARIILLQPIVLEHPRVCHLTGVIATSDHLAALVAAVDGLIGVDTSTAHLADATATPAVTLFSAIAPDLYPYYPLVEALVLPDADKLPAWGKDKVSPEIWAGMADRYEAAWQALDPGTVIAALRRAMGKKLAQPAAFEPRLLSPRAATSACPTRVVDSDICAIEVPLRQREDWMATLLNEIIGNLAAQAVRPGDTVVHLGPGAGEAVVGLARAVGPHGRLVAMEPRRALHQLLCANLARAGLWQAETHLALPEGEGITRREINGLQVADESWPLLLSNSDEPEPVVCWSLDVLVLNACSLLVVNSPLARVPVLQGARATLERLRPVVLIGVVAMPHAEAFETFFDALNYRVRALQLNDPSQPAQSAGYGILVADPMVGPQGLSSPGPGEGMSEEATAR